MRLFRTFGIDTYLRSHVVVWQIVETIKNTVSNLSNNIFDCNACTLTAKICTSFIPCPGGVEGAVMGKDLKGDHLKFMKDANQHMEDFIVKPFSQACTKIWKRTLRRDMLYWYAGITTIGSASFFIVKWGKELTHILITIYIAKEIQKKQACRVITERAIRGIAVCD